jgi:single-strand DNA-binding protein
MPAKSGISKSRPAQTSPAQTSPAQRRSGRTIARTVDSAVALGTNIVIVRAVINRVPESRVLASGDDVLAFDMTIRPEGGPAESVPVIWTNPPAAAHNLAEGDDVVVLGAIRRRFFRSGGTTASRTELNARRIVPAGARAKVRSVLESVLGSLVGDVP